MYDEIHSVSDLPAGWTDEQEGGTYRLKRRDDTALFGYNVGPAFVEEVPAPARGSPLACHKGRRWSAGEQTILPTHKARIYRRARLRIERHSHTGQGVPGRQYVDSQYASRREGLFIVAVNCGAAGATCFCVSMGTGPRADKGFDLSLTEVLDAGRHYFVVEAGSGRKASKCLRESRHVTLPPRDRHGQAQW